MNPGRPAPRGGGGRPPPGRGNRGGPPPGRRPEPAAANPAPERGATAIGQRLLIDLLASTRSPVPWHLYLEKYAPPAAWMGRGGRPADLQLRRNAWGNAARLFGRQAEDMAAVCARQAAWRAALKAQYGDAYVEMALYNTSRLILEIGGGRRLPPVIDVDRSLGVPVISGAAVRRALSRWIGPASRSEGGRPQAAESADAAPEEEPAAGARGDEAASGSGDPGGVHVLGGWPETPPVLRLDLLRARGGGDGRPPEPALVVASGTRWIFGLKAGATGDDGARALGAVVERLRALLTAESQDRRVSPLCGCFAAALPQRAVAPVPSAPVAPRREATPPPKPSRPKPWEHRPPVVLPPCDYTDLDFKAQVLDRLARPQDYGALQQEVLKLQRPQNARYREKLVQVLRGSDLKEVRRRLKDKTWFPAEWL